VAKTAADPEAAKMRMHLPDSVQNVLRQHRAKCAEKTHQIRATYGSTEAYRKTLSLEIVDRPDDARLEEFHRLYKSVFTLEDESEPIEGFAKVLSFNRNVHVQRDFGPFIEPVFVLRDPADGTLAGAANFAIYAYPGRRGAFTFDASCQLNFLLVRDDLRGLGIALDLMDYMEAEIARFARQHCGTHRTFTTIEMNDPSRMTTEQIDADALAALIDPADRTAWWHKRGFRRLELPYIQPPLSADVEACTYLDYYIRCPAPADTQIDAIPSAVLQEHLRRFFTVSVGKFAMNIQHNPEWLATVQFLSHNTMVDVAPKANLE
jgi:GNAT superfamily N-acetyltransferase